jgi:hypothetical protein
VEIINVSRAMHLLNHGMKEAAVGGVYGFYGLHSFHTML